MDSFTLIELLVVMAIIAILAALTLYAGSGIMQTASRKRAMAEIQAMSSSLDAYKNDNAAYPVSSMLLTNNYAASDGRQSGVYWLSSQVLYQALSGQTNFNDTHLAGVKSYMSFKTSQLGNSTANPGTASPASTYIRDPWNASYGYSTGNNASFPYNGNGFFDLWSTGNTTNNQPNATNVWVSNWQVQ